MLFVLMIKLNIMKEDDERLAIKGLQLVTFYRKFTIFGPCSYGKDYLRFL